MRENPRPLLPHIRLYDVAEAHGGIAPDLLHRALVQGGDGFLAGPVARWGVEEDALTVLLVGEFYDEFAFLVARGAVGEALVTAGDELGAVRS